MPITEKEMMQDARKAADQLRRYRQDPDLPANMRTELGNVASLVERQAERIKALEQDATNRLALMCHAYDVWKQGDDLLEPMRDLRGYLRDLEFRLTQPPSVPG